MTFIQPSYTDRSMRGGERWREDTGTSLFVDHQWPAARSPWLHMNAGRVCELTAQRSLAVMLLLPPGSIDRVSEGRRLWCLQAATRHSFSRLFAHWLSISSCECVTQKISRHNHLVVEERHYPTHKLIHTHVCHYDSWSIGGVMAVLLYNQGDQTLLWIKSIRLLTATFTQCDCGMINGLVVSHFE